MAEGDRRTFSTYKTEVLHALGNPDTSDLDITAGNIVNDALEHLASMHEWNWLSTGEQQLDVTADQDYVELPADFGTLLAIEHDTTWTSGMEPVDWDTMLWLRRHPIPGLNYGYYYVINTGNVESGEEDAGLSLPTLNLYPTPAASESGVIRIVYRRFIRRLVNDADRPQWPAYMDRPLSLLARGMAGTDYDDAPESAYTAEFRNLIGDLMARDGLSVGSFGVPGGAVSDPRGSRQAPYGYPDGNIPLPQQV